jgi:D-alanyl-D-alanine carboxypeptidase
VKQHHPRTAAALLLLLATAAARADKVDDTVKAQMQKQHIPGLSLAVIREGKVIKAKGYGLANVELRVPATRDTVFQLGSITKQFTATAIMMLVDEGKVRLDERIPTYVSGLPAAWASATVRHLLTHTSGIKGYTEVPNFHKITVSDASPEEVVKTVADYPLQFQPGEKWAYSNTGYYLLGRIIEKASGKSYADFLQERIFRPLQMTATRVNDLQDIIDNRACGYSWQRGTLRNGDTISMTWPYAAGALVSTVVDLAKWDAALSTDKLLKKAPLEQMWTPAKLSDGKPATYGFGWFIETIAGHRMIGHGGGIPGFATDMSRFADDRLTVVVLTNQERSDPGAISRAVAGLYVPALVPPTLKPIEDREPKVTAMVRDLLQQIIDGRADPERFTPELRADLFPDRIKEGAEFLKGMGPLQTLTLLERKTEGDRRSYRYRITFKDGAILVSLQLTPEEKIAGIQIAPA